MFGSDPLTLRHIPLSEYRKRRTYYYEWRKAIDPEHKNVRADGVEESSYGFVPESNAKVIVED